MVLFSCRTPTMKDRFIVCGESHVYIYLLLKNLITCLSKSSCMDKTKMGR